MSFINNIGNKFCEISTKLPELSYKQLRQQSKLKDGCIKRFWYFRLTSYKTMKKMWGKILLTRFIRLYLDFRRAYGEPTISHESKKSSTTEIKVTLETRAMEKNKKSWNNFCLLPTLVTQTGKAGSEIISQTHAIYGHPTE